MPRKEERYCAKLVSEVLGGVKYKENYRFDFLRGDPTSIRPQGVTLPVDAYYPTYNLVLEFREGQHYGDRFGFRDGRITATGVTRKQQRQEYDQRREDVLPANGVRLLIIYDDQITGDKEQDQKFIKKAVEELLNNNSFIFNIPQHLKKHDTISPTYIDMEPKKLQLEGKTMKANRKCPFCLTELKTKQEIQQNLCGDCYDLRRIIRRIRKSKSD